MFLPPRSNLADIAWAFMLFVVKAHEKNPRSIRSPYGWRKKNIPIFLVVLHIIWVFPKIGVPQNGWFVMENGLFWGATHYFCKICIHFKLLSLPRFLREFFWGDFVHPPGSSWTSTSIWVQWSQTAFFFGRGKKHITSFRTALTKRVGRFPRFYF